MGVVMSIGDSVISNEVLKRTKGHALGLGFVAFGFGMAFFTAIIMFGHLSATVNPAMLLAKALLGRLSWKASSLQSSFDALALMTADVLGAFLGAVFVYGVYFAHFSIVPDRPKPPRWDDAFLRPDSRPEFSRNAYISYEGGGTAVAPETAHPRRTPAQFRYEGSPAVVSAQGGFPVLLERSNSLQVATLLHEHDKARDSAYGEDTDPSQSHSLQPGSSGRAKYLQGTSCPGGTQTSPAPPGNLGHGTDPSPGQGVEHNDLSLVDTNVVDQGINPEGSGRGKGTRDETRVGAREVDSGEGEEEERHWYERAWHTLQWGGFMLREQEQERNENGERPNTPRGQRNLQEDDISELERLGVEKAEVAAYLGALRADQNAKLSCFSSRPAVFNFQANLMTEILCTFLLIWSALMLEERPDLLVSSLASEIVSPLLEPLLIGFLVFGLVVSCAGPTGFAANPARDLGPRVAHAVLPIPNKGPSEWYYAWVPIVGPIIGGFVGAMTFWGCAQLNEYPDWNEEGKISFGGHWDCTNATC
ncbi:unnamed protein product [Choristocarpus tenellus]